MHSSFQLARPLALQSRKNFLKFLASLSINELNTIPIGFNNNIFWNIAHVVATMDILFYKLNSLNPRLDAEFIDAFKKGTQPDSMMREERVEDLKQKLMDQLDWIGEDIENGIIPNEVPKPYMTSFNFELTNLEDVIRFNQIHEGLHWGIVMSLRKFV